MAAVTQLFRSRPLSSPIPKLSTSSSSYPSSYHSFRTKSKLNQCRRRNDLHVSDRPRILFARASATVKGPAAVDKDERVQKVHNTEEFDSALRAAKSRLVVVEYAAINIPNSRKIYPVMVELSRTCSDVDFILVMGDESEQARELCRREGVNKAPHFTFYKDMEKIHEEESIGPDELRGDVLYYGDKHSLVVQLHNRVDVEVNSLLLRHLIAELKGWMETTSGIRAIPVMQFFYRLSSAVGGPFMDSSKPDNLDLEKFVKWFLDEINLDIPFVAKNRTFLGETSILVFMFFTLMLRNWHLPGSDSSQSKSSPVTDTQDKCHISTPSSSQSEHDKDEFASQLVLACSYLRQQTFVNYLMDILQQLSQHFKSSHMNVDGGKSLPSNSGCGSLLFVRKELPAGNFSPFFSDSYAKAHRTDLFSEFHKLLLENTFRLVYSLVRPEKHKTNEKDKTHKTPSGKDLKLDGYHDVLCSYISNPQTAFVRRYARRLFLHMCGSKTHYYCSRDSWQLSNEVKDFIIQVFQ